MRLKKLLEMVPLTLYRGSKEVEITGLSANSKRIAPGNLFIAKKGLSKDGSDYIDEAVRHGAVAILSDIPNPFLKDVVQLLHPDITKIEGILASAFYGLPSKKLFVVGITGTNGKTTTSYLVKHLLDESQIKMGLIGTIEYLIGDKRHPSERTTPDCISNHKMLKEMINEGCQGAVFEVSSHGLAQRRVDAIDFDVAVFTNLTHDHLDYHHTLENYESEKAKLFASLDKTKTAVINIESPASKRMIAACPAHILTYGFSKVADLYADEMQLMTHETRFKANYKGQSLLFTSKLVGKYNVLNLLAAIGVALAKGIEFSSLPPLVESFSGVRGRLERVGSSLIFVDYAHTPDGLENVLRTLQEIKTGRIITVFGCGGDRDKEKRPLMGRIADEFSDVVIVTSDNPRSEDPQVIIKEITSGFKSKSPIVEIDRAKAIELAISLAEKHDLILIAGKGHETVQVFLDRQIAFDDREAVLNILKS